MEQSLVDLTKNPAENNIKNLFNQLRIFSTVLMIVKIGTYIVKEKIHSKMPDVVIKLNAIQNDVPGKLTLLKSVINFFLNSSHLADSEGLSVILRENEVQNSALEVLSYGLDKNSEPGIVEISIPTVRSLT